MSDDEQLTRRGPSGKGADRREEILAAVLDAVAERGFARSTLKEIATRVGTGEANVLHHFGSKQQLLLEAIRRHDQQDMDDLKNPDPGVVAAVVDRHASTPGLVELLINLTVAASDASDASTEFFRDRYDRLRDVGIRSWGPAVTTTSKGLALPPEWLARILLAAADGLQLQWLLDPSINMAGDMELLTAVFGELVSSSSENEEGQ